LQWKTGLKAEKKALEKSVKSDVERSNGNFKGIRQYIFLLFHLEELLKLYVNLFYRFCVTLLFLEIFEQKKSQIS
jgi:hypothetical protein